MQSLHTATKTAGLGSLTSGDAMVYFCPPDSG
jgi:hypothetical protein